MRYDSNTRNTTWMMGTKSQADFVLDRVAAAGRAAFPTVPLPQLLPLPTSFVWGVPILRSEKEKHQRKRQQKDRGLHGAFNDGWVLLPRFTWMRALHGQRRDQVAWYCCHEV